MSVSEKINYLDQCEAQHSASVLTTIDSADSLDDLTVFPSYITPILFNNNNTSVNISCSYCGVGDSAKSSLCGTDKEMGPTKGCVKFTYARMRKRSCLPIHIKPSVKVSAGSRVNIGYSQAIENLADLVLDHLDSDAQILIYACGQVDYFAIFAMQEVFRLLGVRNLTGNAEHCLNAGAVHNEILTGQEGPFVTIDAALEGANKFYIMNGWNGQITHPPVFNELMNKSGFNGALFDVMLTESGQSVSAKLSPDSVGLIKPGSDPLLALSVANRLLECYPQAISQQFINNWADLKSFSDFKNQALDKKYCSASIAIQVAAEPRFEQRIESIIHMIADELAKPETVPVIIPSVGLSQTSGVVGHCLWASVIAMLGKFGIDENSDLIGGVLRLPGQINAESEVQGLSRKYFMGRIPIADYADAASRMSLPASAYQPLLDDEPVAALDYSAPTDKKQLFLFFGTQFEANMPNRQRWIDKLKLSTSSIAVVDPLPDEWSLDNAEIIVPSPPHPAASKLYQNGEWKLTLSIPDKKSAPETRTDATIIYDVMESIVKRFDSDASLVSKYPELERLHKSGYLRQRFCRPNPNTDISSSLGLLRQDGEVSRVQLFDRIQAYQQGGCAEIYCSFKDNSGAAIKWDDLLTHGSVVYGGVGTTRFQLNYKNPGQPFKDIYGEPRSFNFFTANKDDLVMPDGIIMNSGRSSMSDQQRRIDFSVGTFNSGKATPVEDIPHENPVYISRYLSNKIGFKSGDRLRIKGNSGNNSIDLPAIVSERVFGDVIYVSFHRAKSQRLRNLYVNDVTNHVDRCRYTSQTKLKNTKIDVEVLSKNSVISSVLSSVELPSYCGTSLIQSSAYDQWSGGSRDFLVYEVVQETADTTTFRMVSEKPCQFDFLPGQYCAINIKINGVKYTRAYSISSSPAKPHCIDITVKRVEQGLVSNWLADNIIAGDIIDLSYIGGGFHLKEEYLDKPLFFVGAGSGVTPFMSMLRWMVDQSIDIDVDFYISTRQMDDVIFSKELIDLDSKLPSLKLWIIPTAKEYDNSDDMLHGRVSEDLLQRICSDHLQRTVFMCGSDGFMKSAKNALLNLNQPENSILSESFHVSHGLVDENIISDVVVMFDNHDVQAVSNSNVSLLEIAKKNSVDIESVCSTGVCGSCVVKVEGSTTQLPSDVLSQEQLDDGYRLSCICYPQGDCNISLV